MTHPVVRRAMARVHFSASGRPEDDAARLARAEQEAAREIENLQRQIRELRALQKENQDVEKLLKEEIKQISSDMKLQQSRRDDLLRKMAEWDPLLREINRSIEVLDQQLARSKVELEAVRAPRLEINERIREIEYQIEVVRRRPELVRLSIATGGRSAA